MEHEEKLKAMNAVKKPEPVVQPPVDIAQIEIELRKKIEREVKIKMEHEEKLKAMNEVKKPVEPPKAQEDQKNVEKENKIKLALEEREAKIRKIKELKEKAKKDKLEQEKKKVELKSEVDASEEKKKVQLNSEVDINEEKKKVQLNSEAEISDEKKVEVKSEVKPESEASKPVDPKDAKKLAEEKIKADKEAKKLKEIALKEAKKLKEKEEKDAKDAKKLKEKEEKEAKKLKEKEEKEAKKLKELKEKEAKKKENDPKDAKPQVLESVTKLNGEETVTLVEKVSKLLDENKTNEKITICEINKFIDLPEQIFTNRSIVKVIKLVVGRLDLHKDGTYNLDDIAALKEDITKGDSNIYFIFFRLFLCVLYSSWAGTKKVVELNTTTLLCIKLVISSILFTLTNCDNFATWSTDANIAALKDLISTIYTYFTSTVQTQKIAKEIIESINKKSCCTKQTYLEHSIEKCYIDMKLAMLDIRETKDKITHERINKINTISI